MVALTTPHPTGHLITALEQDMEDQVLSEDLQREIMTLGVTLITRTLVVPTHPGHPGTGALNAVWTTFTLPELPADRVETARVIITGLASEKVAATPDFIGLARQRRRNTKLLTLMI